MSPSINSLFGAPDSEAEEDFEIDIDKLMGSVDTALKESTRLKDPALEDEPSTDDPEPEDAPEPEPEIQPSGEPQEAGPEDAPGEPPPIVNADPLGLLVQQADPATRDRILAALREPEADVPPAPALPDDFEPGSPAARLWEENQRTQAQLAQIAEGQKRITEQSARDRAVQAADAAGKEFSARYAGKLDGDDVVRVAQAAGNSGLAARLAAGSDDLKGAYLQALESTLWTEPTFRAKVMEPAAPEEPTPASTDLAESKPRKRKLTALSSSASPVSAPSAPKSPLETRTDGRLTPQSRFKLVQETATKLARDNNEGMF